MSPRSCLALRGDGHETFLVPSYRLQHRTGRRTGQAIQSARRNGRAQPELRLSHLDRQRPAA